jgi:hypothetical protein
VPSHGFSSLTFVLLPESSQGIEINGIVLSQTLSHRLRNCAGREVFHGFGGKQWPHQTF